MAGANGSIYIAGRGRLCSGARLDIRERREVGYFAFRLLCIYFFHGVLLLSVGVRMCLWGFNSFSSSGSLDCWMGLIAVLDRLFISRVRNSN